MITLAVLLSFVTTPAEAEPAQTPEQRAVSIWDSAAQQWSTVAGHRWYTVDPRASGTPVTTGATETVTTTFTNTGVGPGRVSRR